jgi:TRAP-type C4-dicarboxylate transport system permease small subunit
MSERHEFQASSDPQELPAFSLLAERFLTVIAGIILFGTMIMTVIDVFGRYFFAAPLGFAYEMTELAMAVTFFIALSAVTLRGEHINVGLFDAFFVGRVAALREMIVSVVVAIGAAFLCWRMFLFAGTLAAYGDTTHVLKIYLYPFAYTGTLGLGLAAAAGAVRVAMAMRRLVSGTA